MRGTSIGISVLSTTIILVTCSVWVAPTLGDTGAKDPAGTLAFEFDTATLDASGVSLVADGPKAGMAGAHRPIFPITAAFPVETDKDSVGRLVGTIAQASGALLFTAADNRIAIGNLLVTVSDDGIWTISDTLDAAGPQVVFELSSVTTSMNRATKGVQVVAEVSLARGFARELGFPELADVAIGVMTLDLGLDGVVDGALLEESTRTGSESDDTDGGIQRIGPDVIVGDLPTVMRFGRVGDITAYSIGTTSCNIGDERLSWISSTNQHPVISQSMFRLKGGRIEQIGLSWLKHGFYALSGSLCSSCNDPTNGNELGVGCSDPYSSYLNGVQGNLGKRSDVDAFTGYFPYPWSAPPAPATIGRRLQVHDADLEPSLNVGATYFLQGHYVAPDDAFWGNAHNNASYRRALVSESGSSVYNVSPTGATQREQAAIRAWKDNDDLVHEMEVLVDGEGLFILASKATDLGGGVWHYEYALQNINSDRCAGSFSVPLSPGAVLENIGFHDVDYHSGEPYDLTDWSATEGVGTISWTTLSYGENANANALRWGTLYNFRFDARAAPQLSNVTIGLFKPGTPTEVTGTAYAPMECAAAAIPLGDPLVPDTGSGTKNRYLSFSGGSVGGEQAIRVTTVSLPGFEYAEGRITWVQEPTEVTETSGLNGSTPSPTSLVAGLGCEPYFANWNELGVVDVLDAVIVPEGTYALVAVDQACSSNDPAFYSDPFFVTLGGLGDIVGNCESCPCSPPNGVKDMLDITAVVDKFRNAPCAVRKAQADITGAGPTSAPNLTVDFIDIALCVDAFRNLEVPVDGPPLDDPCPETGGR